MPKNAHWGLLATFPFLVTACAKESENSAESRIESQTLAQVSSVTAPEVSEEPRWSPEAARSIDFTRWMDAQPAGAVVRLESGIFTDLEIVEGLSVEGAGRSETKLIYTQTGQASNLSLQYMGARISVRNLTIETPADAPKSDYGSLPLLSIRGGGIVENLQVGPGVGHGMSLSNGIFTVREVSVEGVQAPALETNHAHPNSLFENIALRGEFDGPVLRLENDTGGTFRNIEMGEFPEIVVSGELSSPIFEDLDAMALNDIVYEWGAQPHYDGVPPEAIAALKETFSGEITDFSMARAMEFESHQIEMRPRRVELAAAFLHQIEDAATPEAIRGVVLAYIADLFETYSDEQYDPWVDRVVSREMQQVADSQGLEAAYLLVMAMPAHPMRDPFDMWYYFEEATTDALLAYSQERAAAEAARKAESGADTIARLIAAEAAPEALAGAFVEIASGAEESTIAEAFAPLVASANLPYLTAVLERFPAVGSTDTLPNRRVLLRELPAELRREVLAALKS